MTNFLSNLRFRTERLQTANDRAANLLKRYLTKEQWRSLTHEGYFSVAGSDGYEYRIHPDFASNVIRESQPTSNSPRLVICGVLPECEPLCDQMLAQMLILTTDAPRFLASSIVMEC